MNKNIKVFSKLSIVKFDAQYKKNLAILDSVKKDDETKFAVVIHLFYIDNWPLFTKKLNNLSNYKYDLYITMPKSNESFIDNIKLKYPNATIITVPNLGRDILPFINVAQKLYKMGYEYVLKFHSKKSTHRDDGQIWLEDMLNKLLPDDQTIIDKIQTILLDKNTGLVGPSGVYYPLTVNFPANGVHMMNIVKRLYNKQVAYNYLQNNRTDHGFFGGTMFWARLDAIQGLLSFSNYCFELESGQIDGTFAHALERMFAVVPEIENRNNYEITEKNVIDRPYKSLNIPDWSKDHDKQ